MPPKADAALPAAGTDEPGHRVIQLFSRIGNQHHGPGDVVDNGDTGQSPVVITMVSMI
jgi:hypothetical protein